MKKASLLPSKNKGLLLIVGWHEHVDTHTQPERPDLFGVTEKAWWKLALGIMGWR